MRRWRVANGDQSQISMTMTMGVDGDGEVHCKVSDRSIILPELVWLFNNRSHLIGK